jgi:hypothetical protein
MNNPYYQIDPSQLTPTKRSVSPVVIATCAALSVGSLVTGFAGGYFVGRNTTVTSGPSAPTAAATSKVSNPADARPTITLRNVKKDLIGMTVTIPADALHEESDWTFQRNEPSQIQLLETKALGDKQEIIIQVDTQSAPGEEEAHLSGKLKLNYEWIGGDWELRNVESVTFNYIE